jgi:hypothetical protein
METVAVTLPGGIMLDGSWHRTAWLRALCGQDEAFLTEEACSLLPALRVTALLARCLTRLGPLSPVSREAVQALAVGDREALLLHLRRLTLGERIECVLSCPKPECGEKLDLDLTVSDLLVAPYSHVQPWYERTIIEDGKAYRVRFRLPNGADLEAAASLALSDVNEAANLVLQRCVEEVNVDGDTTLSGSALPQAVVANLSQAMADLDPQAEMVLDLTCPACGAAFCVLFDTADYLFRELSAERLALYREVHLLAFYYHWSESEIMTMTRRKRRLYLSLLAEALDRGGRQ